MVHILWVILRCKPQERLQFVGSNFLYIVSIVLPFEHGNDVGCIILIPIYMENVFVNMCSELNKFNCLPKSSRLICSMVMSCIFQYSYMTVGSCWLRRNSVMRNSSKFWEWYCSTSLMERSTMGWRRGSITLLRWTKVCVRRGMNDLNTLVGCLWNFRYSFMRIPVCHRNLCRNSLYCSGRYVQCSVRLSCNFICWTSNMSLLKSCSIYSTW